MGMNVRQTSGLNWEVAAIGSKPKAGDVRNGKSGSDLQRSLDHLNSAELLSVLDTLMARYEVLQHNNLGTDALKSALADVNAMISMVSTQLSEINDAYKNSVKAAAKQEDAAEKSMEFAVAITAGTTAVIAGTSALGAVAKGADGATEEADTSIETGLDSEQKGDIDIATDVDKPDPVKVEVEGESSGPVEGKIVGSDSQASVEGHAVDPESDAPVEGHAVVRDSPTTVKVETDDTVHDPIQDKPEDVDAAKKSPSRVGDPIKRVKGFIGKHATGIEVSSAALGGAAQGFQQQAATFGTAAAARDTQKADLDNASAQKAQGVESVIQQVATAVLDALQSLAQNLNAMLTKVDDTVGANQTEIEQAIDKH